MSKDKTKHKVYGPHKKLGAPSLISKFPSIPDTVTEFVKLKGYQSQDRRRDDNFRSCGVTAKDIRSHLLKSVAGLDHGISLTTIRYLFVPFNKGRISAKRYLIKIFWVYN